MQRSALVTFLLLAPALQAAHPEIRAIILNAEIEGVLERIWSSSGDACIPDDPAEDRLRLAAIAETDPFAQIELLSEWEKAFPSSPRCETYRLWLGTLAYARTGHAERAAELGGRLLHHSPVSLERWFTRAWLASGIADPSEWQVQQMREASFALFGALGAIKFRVAPSEGLTGSAIRDAVSLVARLASGTAAFNKKNWAKAQMDFRAAKRIMPESAFLAIKLGESLLALGDSLTIEDAFRSYVSAAENRGPGALSETDRQEVEEYVQRMWRIYTGGSPYEELLEAVRTGAPFAGKRASEDRTPEVHYSYTPPPPFPQPYWMSLLAKDPPFRDLWVVLRNPETSDSIWEDLLGKLTPRMKLFVVRTEPIDNPRTIFLGAGNKTFVVLELSEPLAESIPKGRSVQFEGIAKSFQREPFLLTLRDGLILD